MDKTPTDAALKQDHAEAMAQRIDQLTRTVTLYQSRIKLLEEENTRFADMLRERGVNVRASSKLAVELPPPVTEPLSDSAEIFGEMSPSERALFRECSAGEPCFVLVETKTAIDTGGWFSRGRIWMAALGKDIVIVAAGKKPFLERIPFLHIQESLYNHVTGEFVLAPPRGLRVTSAGMTPIEGYQLLAQIYSNKETKS